MIGILGSILLILILMHFHSPHQKNLIIIIYQLLLSYYTYLLILMDAFNLIKKSKFMDEMFECLCRPDDLHYNGVAGELYTRLCSYDEDIPLSLLFSNLHVRDDEYTSMRIIIEYFEATSSGIQFPVEATRAVKRAWIIIKNFMEDDGGYQCYDIPGS